jgi:hypothetical protein
MSTRFLTKVDDLAAIENYPQDGGIAFYHGVPFARTEAGLFALSGVPIGKAIYLDPANGDDTNDGLTPATAKATLDGTAGAFSLATAGKNDTIYIISDGATTSTVRVDAAFDWNKNATHLIGISSGVNVSNRSRIAPTPATTAFANFFTVSASGCRFQNVQWFHGFNTGTTSAICLTVSGGRNMFIDCHIAGMGDAASAADAGSRSLKIATTGENMFVRCTIGLDTVTRSAANASVEFAGVGNPRNQFIDCVFPFMCSAATPLGIKVAGAAASDRFQMFLRCLFINATKSSSTAMTALTTLAASIGGMIILKDCTAIGITDLFSDATTSGQMFIDGAAPTAATTGLGINPA